MIALVTLLLLLVVPALAGIVGAVALTARDGYRPIPTDRTRLP